MEGVGSTAIFRSGATLLVAMRSVLMSINVAVVIREADRQLLIADRLLRTLETVPKRHQHRAKAHNAPVGYYFLEGRAFTRARIDFPQASRRAHSASHSAWCALPGITRAHCALYWATAASCRFPSAIKSDAASAKTRVINERAKSETAISVFINHSGYADNFDGCPASFAKCKNHTESEATPINFI